MGDLVRLRSASTALLEAAISEVVDYAIFVLDPGGHIATWNKGAKRLKGYEEAEIIGRHFSIFYPAAEVRAGKCQHELDTAEEVGRFEEEGWRIRKDGSRFWAHVIITAIKDEQGRLQGFTKVTRDLTARRSTEEALRRSEERLRLLVGSVRDYAIFMLDVTGRIQTWNVGAEAIKGYGADEIIGKHISCFYTEEDRRNGKAERLLGIAEREGRVEDEGWRVRKDGTRFWADVIITAARDEAGRLVGFAKVTRDLTVRREAEEGLRRSEERLRLLVGSVKDYAIFMLDAEGRVQTWNAGAEAAKGYSAREIVGQHVSRFYLDEDVAAGKPGHLLAQAAADGRVESEGWRVRKDGSRFWADVVITAIRDRTGTLVGFAKVTRDLTDRRAAEESARRLAREQEARTTSEQALERLRFLARAGTELAGVLDYEVVLRKLAGLVVPLLADWSTVAAVDDSGEFRRLAVVTNDPSKAGLAREYEEKFPPDNHRAGPQTEALLNGQSILLPVVEDAELEAAAQDEAHLRVLRGLGVRSCIIVPLMWRGRAIGLLSLMRSKRGGEYTPLDLALAEEVTARSGLAVENAKLFQEQVLARKKLEGMTDALQEAVQARDLFLSVASHELKTPLTPLALRLQAVEKLTATQPESEYVQQVKRFTEVGRKQMLRLSALVNDLLDVSRISSGKFKMEMETVDLALLAREVVTRLETQAQAAGAPISLLAPGTLLLRTARLRMDQVLTNLVENAIKYGAGSPIEIRVEVERCKAKVSVTDYGIGISPEKIPLIFERFERGVSDRHYGGLGLGLYIARSIVEALGGEVEVQSQLGKGSTFTVVLPLGLGP